MNLTKLREGINNRWNKVNIQFVGLKTRELAITLAIDEFLSAARQEIIEPNGVEAGRRPIQTHGASTRAHRRLLTAHAAKRGTSGQQAQPESVTPDCNDCLHLLTCGYVENSIQCKDTYTKA